MDPQQIKLRVLWSLEDLKSADQLLAAIMEADETLDTTGRSVKGYDLTRQSLGMVRDHIRRVWQRFNRIEEEL